MTDKDLELVERLIAAATHDIMNGLASVGQASGLMGDLLKMGLAGGSGGLLSFLRPPAKDDPAPRFKKSIANIQTSADRCRDIAAAVNNFAHSLRPAQDPTPCKQVVETLTVLMRRIAAQKRTELKAGKIADNAHVAPPLTTVYRALVACVDDLLITGSKGCSITLSCAIRDTHVVFSVVGNKLKPSSQTPPALQDVAELLAKRDGSVVQNEAGYEVLAIAALQ